MIIERFIIEKLRSPNLQFKKTLMMDGNKLKITEKVKYQAKKIRKRKRSDKYYQDIFMFNIQKSSYI